jgi:hypothetical protein
MAHWTVAWTQQALMHIVLGWRGPLSVLFETAYPTNGSVMTVPEAYPGVSLATASTTVENLFLGATAQNCPSRLGAIHLDDPDPPWRPVVGPPSR